MPHHDAAYFDTLIAVHAIMCGCVEECVGWPDPGDCLIWDGVAGDLM